MFRALIHWLLSAIALLLVSHFVTGFEVSGLLAAMEAAVVIGFLNATLGLLMKAVTFPFVVLTIGIFLIVINAAMILLASKIVPGFYVTGWVAAFWGALAMALLGMVIRAVMKDE
jgi:putative membrane protein